MEHPVGSFLSNDFSFLDKDDINGPGIQKYVKRTGDKSIDYAFFKISQYSSSNDVSERIKFTKELKELVLQLGSRNLQVLTSVIKRLVEDIVEIKTELASQLPLVAEVLSNDFQLYPEVMNIVLPALDKLLDDKNPDILKSACQATVSLSQILTPDDNASFLLTSVLRTLHDEDEEIKIRALSTLKDLIENISSDMCECFVVKEATLLSTESIVKVRKAVAEMIPKIIKKLKTEEKSAKVLQIYEVLAKDSIWGVRKSCVESLPDIMESLSLETQEKTLLPLFEELLNDKSNSVRLCAMGKTGNMIHQCKGKVPDFLISAYLDLSKNTSNKGELQHHCAFYFPAVLLKLGPGCWNSLSPSYAFLAAEGDLKVKKAIISGIHEIGKILGPEIATAELVPIFEKIYNESAAAKQLAAGYLSRFLSVLSLDSRITYLIYVKTMHKISANWRIRLSISEQLVDLLQIYDIETCCKDLSPIILALAEDKYAKVRETAAPGLGCLISQIISPPSNPEIVQLFRDFSKKSYLSKQTFLLACQSLTPTVISSHFSAELKNLSEDKSANIRMLCGKILKKFKDSSFKSLEEKLVHDFDADVRFEVTGKYDVERGFSRLRPDSKKISELMQPMLRALFRDEDIGEIVRFGSQSQCGLEMIKSPVVPSMNGFVEEITLDRVAKSKMLIEI